MICYTNKHIFSDGENMNISKQTIYKSEAIHIHEFIEVVYIFSGSGKHYIDQVEYNVKKGDLLFINYGQTHSFQTQSTMSFYNILLKPEFLSEQMINSENAFELLTLTAFEEFRTSINTNKPLVTFGFDELTNIEYLTNIMFKEYSDKNIGYQSSLKGYMMAFFVHIFRKMSVSETILMAESTKITTNLLDYIEKHCNEKLTLNALAKKCFYNPTYFSRVFKDSCGITLTEFIDKKRIERSCELLKTTKDTIDDICSLVGYSDKTQFYKKFKQYTETTPACYRNNYKS